MKQHCLSLFNMIKCLAVVFLIFGIAPWVCLLAAIENRKNAIEEGQSLAVNCSLPSVHVDCFNISHAYLKIRDSVTHHEPEVLSPNLVQFRIENVTCRRHIGPLNCLVNSSAIYRNRSACSRYAADETILLAWKKIDVTRRPLIPSVSSCVIGNWTWVECSWRPSVADQMKHGCFNNANLMHHFLFVQENQSSRWIRVKCPDGNGEIRRWQLSSDDASRDSTGGSRCPPKHQQLQQQPQQPWRQQNRMCVRVGVLFTLLPDLPMSSDPHCFNLDDQVLLDPVVGLEATNVTSSSVRLRWSHPFVPSSFSGQIVYKISYRSQWQDEVETLVKESVAEFEHLLPYSHYTFQIQAATSAGNVWSQAETLTLRTSPSVPRQQPGLWENAFFIRSLWPNDTQRDVTIYWKKTAARDESGPGFGYEVRIKVQNRIVFSTRTSSTSAVLRLTDGETSVEILATNDVGLAQAPQKSMAIPAALPEHSNLSAVEDLEMTADGNNTRIVIHWNLHDNSSSFGGIRQLDIYWCEPHHNLTYTCKGELNSTTTNLSARSIELSLEKHFGAYIIGFSVVTANAPTVGIQWIGCIYDWAKARSPPQKLAVSSPGDDDDVDETVTQLLVTWAPSQCHEQKYIHKYIVSYRNCSNRICSEAKEEEVEPKYLQHHIRGLSENTTYRVSVSSEFTNGSRSHPNTTTVTTRTVTIRTREHSDIYDTVGWIVVSCLILISCGIIVILGLLIKRWFLTKSPVFIYETQNIRLLETDENGEIGLIYSPALLDCDNRQKKHGTAVNYNRITHVLNTNSISCSPPNVWKLKRDHTFPFEGIADLGQKRQLTLQNQTAANDQKTDGSGISFNNTQPSSSLYAEGNSGYPGLPDGPAVEPNFDDLTGNSQLEATNESSSCESLAIPSNQTGLLIELERSRITQKSPSWPILPSINQPTCPSPLLIHQNQTASYDQQMDCSGKGFNTLLPSSSSSLGKYAEGNCSYPSLPDGPAVEPNFDDLIGNSRLEARNKSSSCKSLIIPSNQTGLLIDLEHSRLTQDTAAGPILPSMNQLNKGHPDQLALRSTFCYSGRKQRSNSETELYILPKIQTNTSYPSTDPECSWVVSDNPIWRILPRINQFGKKSALPKPMHDRSMSDTESEAISNYDCKTGQKQSRLPGCKRDLQRKTYLTKTPLLQPQMQTSANDQQTDNKHPLSTSDYDTYAECSAFDGHSEPLDTTLKPHISCSTGQQKSKPEKDLHILPKIPTNTPKPSSDSECSRIIGEDNTAEMQTSANDQRMDNEHSLLTSDLDSDSDTYAEVGVSNGHSELLNTLALKPNDSYSIGQNKSMSEKDLCILPKMPTNTSNLSSGSKCSRMTAEDNTAQMQTSPNEQQTSTSDSGTYVEGCAFNGPTDLLDTPALEQDDSFSIGQQKSVSEKDLSILPKRPSNTPNPLSGSESSRMTVEDNKRSILPSTSQTIQEKPQDNETEDNTKLHINSSVSSQDSAASNFGIYAESRPSYNSCSDLLNQPAVTPNINDFIDDY